MADITTRILEFAREKKFAGKGALCVALVVTQHARTMGLPLNAEKLITEGGGQVLGLGRGAVQTILERHGVDRILAAEGGRTSRGSLKRMQEYVAFLNQLGGDGGADLEAIETFWIGQVHKFFAAKPFRLTLDASQSLRSVVRDVIAQAEERQKASQGVYYAGAVLQHLVGTKLDCALGSDQIVHNSFSTSDQQKNRVGDFLVGDVAVHVATSPGEMVIKRCEENLKDILRPVIVTMQQGATVAEGLATNLGLHKRIDIFEAEQFVALNLYELGGFAAKGRRAERRREK